MQSSFRLILSGALKCNLHPRICFTLRCGSWEFWHISQSASKRGGGFNHPRANFLRSMQSSVWKGFPRIWGGRQMHLLISISISCCSLKMSSSLTIYLLYTLLSFLRIALTSFYYLSRSCFKLVSLTHFCSHRTLYLRSLSLCIMTLLHICITYLIAYDLPEVKNWFLFSLHS